MSESLRDENDLLFDVLKSGGTVIPLELDDEGKPVDPDGFARTLAEVLASIQPAWVRLRHDPEWSGQNVLSVNQVVGAMLAGVMNSSGEYTKNGVGPLLEDEIPDDLTGLARFLKYELTHTYQAPHYFRTIFHASLCEIGEFVWSRIQEGNWFNERTCAPDVAVHNGLIALRNDLRESARFEERCAAKTSAEIEVELRRTDGDGI